ncbi:amidohydrolase family protein [Azohydromonas aeria]|uniref:amidohydrolase family protein n=1 Tax=Azohydromonas aeria TaxID=2590212 RepID=UPI0012FA2076|nr:amidohydrolase family protein [Azohydromonas aeria]
MLFTCSPNCRDPRHRHHGVLPVTAASATGRTAARNASSAPGPRGGDEAAAPAGGPTIDVHCHYLNTAVAAKAAALEPARHDPSTIFASELTRATNTRQMAERAAQLSDIPRRLADMDRMGIDVQVVSPAPFQYYYFADPAKGSALAREVNEGLQALVGATPARFAALGTVPLQDCKLAMRELEYAVTRLGLRGVEIGTNVNGLNLTDPRLGLERFFALADELEAVVFLHPVGFTHAQRLTEHYFNNVIGNPLDTTVAASHLIFDGFVARFPRVKFLLAHGGGYLAHYWARMDHAWRARPDCRAAIDEAPSTFLRRMYFDTVVFDPTLLGRLVEQYGADHVLLGSDYPYDMGDDDPAGLVAAVAGLPAAQRQLILGGNAARLFGLPDLARTLN